MPQLQYAMNKIRAERLARKWSQGDLAQACGWEDAAGRVSNYENLSREPALADLDKMATAVGLTLAEALFGRNLENNNDKQSTGSVQLPLLKMEEITDWMSGNLTENNRSVNMHIAAIDVGNKLLAVTMEGDAMESSSKLKTSICDGDRIAVDINRQPKPKDIVIANVNGETVVREYAKDGTKLFLKAYNPAYEHIDFNDTIKIIGVVVSRQVVFQE